jgi:hypothetical protein
LLKQEGDPEVKVVAAMRLRPGSFERAAAGFRALGQTVVAMVMAVWANAANMAKAAMAGVTATELGLSSSEQAAVTFCESGLEWMAAAMPREVCLERLATVVLDLGDFERVTVGLHTLREVGTKVLAGAKRPISNAFGWVVD